MENYKYKLNGLDCAHCAKKIEDKIAKTDGYENVKVSFSTCKLSFKTDKQDNVKEDITAIVKSVEPDIDVVDYKQVEHDHISENTERDKLDILRLAIGVLIYLFAAFVPGIKDIIAIRIIFLIISLVILLSKTAQKAYKQIMQNRVLDENTLITISVIGACLVGKEMEGVMVIALYEIGKILEAKAVSKTRKSISDLMDIKPEYANLKTKIDSKKVNPEEVKIGDVILVKAGEKIPLDGVVIKGDAEIDNSALTGESVLVKVEKGSEVLSGGINVQGLLEIKVTKTYENSTVSQILNLVENATDKKAKTETFVSKAAKIYTPVVLGLAAIVAIFMPLTSKDITYSQSIYKALIFLVISCPCSIAISVPLSYFSGIGRASRSGILIKGSDYLDGLKDICEMIFDKTGTITTGEFKVSNISVLDDNYTEDEIMSYFAMGESFSNHPIAKSIIKEVTDGVDITNVNGFEEFPGKGITYRRNNEEIKIGNATFVKLQSVLKENIGTTLYLKINDNVVGSITLIDEPKSDAKDVMKKLSRLGIRTRMLTGDKKAIGKKIAKEVGITEVKTELLPQDKYKELERILNKNNYGKKVAYVGDGINDSPVLARADIGISMGGIGSNSAIEASDVVIMTDELNKIVEAIDISKFTNRIIIQNLVFAIGVKFLILVTSILGITDMWEAVFADVGTTLITILNTIRILKKRN